LIGGVYLNGYACDSCSADAGDIGGGLRSLRSNADRRALASNTGVADIDIVTAGGEICTG